MQVAAVSWLTKASIDYTAGCRLATVSFLISEPMDYGPADAFRFGLFMRNHDPSNETLGNLVNYKRYNMGVPVKSERSKMRGSTEALFFTTVFPLSRFYSGLCWGRTHFRSVNFVIRVR